MCSFVNPEGGFFITSGSDIYPGVTDLAKDDSIYVLNFKRDRFKDQLQPGTWTLTLSGSHAGTPKTISLTDGGRLPKSFILRYNSKLADPLIAAGICTPESHLGEAS